MFDPGLEEKLRHAREALGRAKSENIIEVCRQYLALLAQYRDEIYKLQGTPAVESCPGSSSGAEVFSNRQAVRAAIEVTTQERNRTTALLHSFTVVSGYEAVETFNRRKYKGRDDWELRAGGIRFGGGCDTDKMTLQEAVEITSLLRREAYLVENAWKAEPVKSRSSLTAR